MPASVDQSSASGQRLSNPLIDAAKNDLANRLGISVEGIKVVAFKAVIWPDGSLGCPRPGMAYTQVQVDGALIALQVGKRIYRYHSGGGRGPFLCENPDKGVDGQPPDDLRSPLTRPDG